MSQANVDTVRVVYEEWAKGNFRAGADLLDRHVLYISPENFPEQGPFLGREGVREFMQGWLGPFEHFSIAAEEVIEAGDSVVIAACQRGVGKESGVATKLRFFHVWTFRGGAVIRLEFFVDRAEALEAAGLSE